MRVHANGIELNVTTAGTGPAVLLLHGWPHTWQVWQEIIPDLATRYRVIAPDLRGAGASTRAESGYDALNQAADLCALLDALGEPSAAVVAIDAAVPTAALLGLHHPDRVRQLVLMEALLPGLPPLPASWPPWWFGFHAVPGFAEIVLSGHEGEYLDWFLTSGTAGDGVPHEVRDAFVAAYTGTEALRCGFEFYRAIPATSAQFADAITTRRLSMPTMAIGANVVGHRLRDQLTAIADDLVGHVIPDCGHIIPLHRPAALLELLLPRLDGGS